MGGISLPGKTSLDIRGAFLRRSQERFLHAGVAGGAVANTG